MGKKITTDILILGAGIGGYATFRTLSRLLKRYHIKKTITIIDQNNYFTFVPMLHEVAVGSIEPHHAAIALRDLLCCTPHQYIKARVQHIDPKKKEVRTSEGIIVYAYCVVALGSEVNFFDVPGAREHTYTVRTLPDAMQLHNDFLQALEHPRQKRVSLVIVGGGWTGVELTGQFADFARDEGERLYGEKKIDIHLVHSGATILPQLPAKVQKRVTERLKWLGVHIHFNARAKGVTEESVDLSDGTKIKNDIAIWTAGFLDTAHCVLSEKECMDGRIPLTQHLHHDAYPSLYGVGDVARIFNPHQTIPVPQLGEAAYKEGQYVARHIVASIRGRDKKMKPFVFRSMGNLIPIGDWYGAAVIGPIIFFGWFAWWLRRTAYLIFIPGVIRKLRIVIDWTLHSFGSRHTLSMEKRKK